jgi:uncharacterized protein YjbI with pentapeptide repeats
MRSALAWAVVVTVVVAADAGAAWAAKPSDVKKLDDVAKFSTCANCDLSGADLQKRLFRLANWPGANLQGAKLDNSDLAGAILWETDFRGASMTYVNLSGAQMMGAKLGGANLQFAWLLHAQAQNVDFGDADLTNARVTGMQVQGADLSRVKGLGPAEIKTLCGDGQTKAPGDAWIPRCTN